jgi:hypothetical protein
VDSAVAVGRIDTKKNMSANMIISVRTEENESVFRPQYQILPFENCNAGKRKYCHG